MKIKKIILGIICLIILAVSLVQAEIADSSKIEVSLISQNPDPANPGEVIDLRFKVENRGSDAAEDIIFEFIEKYPFSVYDRKVQQNIGSLQGWQRNEEGVIVLYPIKIDENAVQGTFYVDIRYKVGTYSTKWITVKDFPVRIRTRDVILSIESIISNPDPVSPGDEFALSFILKNNADSLIRDIAINLDLSSTTIPIAPSKSTAEKQIYQINSRTGKSMVFELIALPDADGGIYKIPINISYTDETGTSYTKDDYISLKIASPPNLLVTIDSSEVYKETKSGKVVIKITNRGLTDIKLLSARLLETGDIELLSEPEVYVGNIDSDDYETVDFKINVKSYEKSIDFPLEVTYMDSTNKQFKEEINLTLKTSSPGKIITILKRMFNGILIIIVIIGVGLGIYWLYKRRKRKRQG